MTSKMKQHLVKKAAIVAITLTSIGIAGGSAEAGSTPVAVKKVASCAADQDTCSQQPPVMMSRAGIRW